MWKKNKHTGFAIAMAWPETLCKQPGSWYDAPLKRVGINKNHYYKIGHAAVVLIHGDKKKCHYFDFGRYHAPFQYGRVRDAETDHDLEVKTKAIINDKGQIVNNYEIISEIFSNPSCHGTGTLHSSYCKINFESAFAQAKQMQEQSPIKYGPFQINGTNCSRFVNRVLLSGKPSLLYRFLLSYPKTISPTPLENVRVLDNYLQIAHSEEMMEAYILENRTPKQIVNESY